MFLYLFLVILLVVGEFIWSALHWNSIYRLPLSFSLSLFILLLLCFSPMGPLVISKEHILVIYVGVKHSTDWPSSLFLYYTDHSGGSKSNVSIFVWIYLSSFNCHLQCDFNYTFALVFSAFWTCDLSDLCWLKVFIDLIYYILMTILYFGDIHTGLKINHRHKPKQIKIE